MAKQKGDQGVVQVLSTVLADTYVIYVKTQNFHWNVEDKRFHSLHEFFEEHYTTLAEAVDEIAERIRMVGSKSPGSLSEFLRLTRLQEAKGVYSGDQMIKELLKDHESLIANLKKHIQEVQKAGDEGTADLLIQRLRAHEKMAWMLKAHL